jgi:hypothetical protein
MRIEVNQATAAVMRVDARPLQPERQFGSVGKIEERRMARPVGQTSNRLFEVIAE